MYDYVYGKHKMLRHILPMCNACYQGEKTFLSRKRLPLAQVQYLIQLKNAVTKTKTGNEVVKNVKEERKKKRRSQSAEIKDYFETKQCLKNVYELLPQKILKVTRRAPDSIYLVDEEVADEMMYIIKEDILQGDSPIIEANPGVAFITKRLLNAGAVNIQLYEGTSDFMPRLRTVAEEHECKVLLYHTNFFDLSKMKFRDKIDNGSRVESILNQIPRKDWKDEPALRIIGVLPSLNFLKHVILSHILQTGLMVQGRPEMFLVMKPEIYHVLTSNSDSSYRSYRSVSVIFQLIFETVLLAKLPRKAFLPWLASSSAKKGKVHEFKNEDQEMMYLVKICARRNFFEEVVPVEQLQPLWYFIRTHMMSRHSKIIPQLEQWIPGCGPRLIIKGMNIFTEFGSLNPPEMLDLFKQFISWPEYPDSNFISSMESNFMKSELLSDEFESSSHSEINDDSETLDVEDKS